MRKKPNKKVDPITQQRDPMLTFVDGLHDQAEENLASIAQRQKELNERARELTEQAHQLGCDEHDHAEYQKRQTQHVKSTVRGHKEFLREVSKIPHESNRVQNVTDWSEDEIQQHLDFRDDQTTGCFGCFQFLFWNKRPTSSRAHQQVVAERKKKSFMQYVRGFFSRFVCCKRTTQRGPMRSPLI